MRCSPARKRVTPSPASFLARSIAPRSATRWGWEAAVYYAFFFQDDFKVNSRLSLNLGLRWEYQPPFTEVADRFSSWNQDKRDPVTGLLGAYHFAGNCDVCTGSRILWTRQVPRLGPRIGFAYRPLIKLTLRGAYGIMYEGDLFNGFGGTPLGGRPVYKSARHLHPGCRSCHPWRGIFNWIDGLPTDRYARSF